MQRCARILREVPLVVEIRVRETLLMPLRGIVASDIPPAVVAVQTIKNSQQARSYARSIAQGPLSRLVCDSTAHNCLAIIRNKSSARSSECWSQLKTQYWKGGRPFKHNPVADLCSLVAVRRWIWEHVQDRITCCCLAVTRRWRRWDSQYHGKLR